MMCLCLYRSRAYEVGCVALGLEHGGHACHAPRNGRAQFRTVGIVRGRIKIHHVNANRMAASLHR